MTLVGDHSTGGAIIGGSLRAAGFEGIIRYACGGRGDVNITPQEVADLKANGLGIGIVLEHEADWLLRPSRVADRVAASRAVTRTCGLPDGVTYMAADFDVTEGGPTATGSAGDQNMSACRQSLTIAANELGGWGYVGWYGSKFSIDWLISHGVPVPFFWQTEAWSMGQRSPHACLFQQARSVNIAGVDVDLDPVWSEPWGRRGSAPSPAPTPHPIRKEDMITSVLNKDGRLEVFVEKNDSGEVFHAYQESQNGPWAGSEPGRNARWYSLGIPGTK